MNIYEVKYKIENSEPMILLYGLASGVDAKGFAYFP